MRERAKTDANQRAVVAELRAHGATVQSLASVGRGCPDLLVGYQGRNFVFELKDGSKPPSARALTEPEAQWQAAWRGDVRTVKTAAEALNYMAATLAGRTAGHPRGGR